MRKLTHTIFLSLALSFGLKAQTHNPFHQTLVDQVQYANIESNLTSFVNFGVKEMGSNAQLNAFNWLKSMYESWGYTDIEEQAVNVWGQLGYNLIVTKQGTVYPDTYIIIDGHYDTIFGPGANDNGSGTSIILEAARILKDIPTEYSIKFIHFTGEEVGLVGSQRYVDQIVIPQNLDIKLVFNIDQVGGVAGDINDTITCERDQSYPTYNNDASAQVTNELRVLMELYSNLNTTLGPTYGSDYEPFQEEGFVITGLYETNESPYTHSSQDTLEHLDLDFVFQVAKGTLGALCYFAKAYGDMGIMENSSQGLQLYPNPADKKVFVKFDSAEVSELKISDLTGKTILTQKIQASETELNTANLPNGIYLIQINQEKAQQTQKLIVQHK